MASRDLNYRIGATDDASRVIEASARKIAKAQKDVQGEFDTTGSKIKNLASTVGSMTDKIEGALDDTASIAERLGQSMPDEDARRFAEMLSQAGISAQDLDEHTEELVAQMRRLEDVSQRAGSELKGGLSDAEDGVRRLGENGDQTRSVLANMVGNSAQDLGALGGVAGTAGMAVSQLAEYSVEGGVALANLAKVAGPMALLGIGVASVTKTMESLSARQQQFEEDTRSLTQALLEGADASSTLAEKMTESGRAIATVTTDNNFGEWLVSLGDETSHGTADITDALDHLGMTVQQFTDLASGNGEGIMEWRQAMTDAGLAGDDLTLVNNALWATWDQVQQAADGAAVMHRIGADATENAARATQRASEQLEIYRQRNDEAREALQRRVDGVLAAADADLALRNAARERQAAEEAAANTTDDSATAIDEHAEALDRAEQAARSEIDAILAAAEAHYGAASSVEDSRTRQINAIQQVAGELAPDSPLRARLQGYIDQLNAIPTARNTTISTTYNAAFASQAKAPSQIFGGARAAGGPTSAGRFYEVNEHGSELLHEGGRTFLMAGSNGTVEPLAGMAPAGVDMGRTEFELQWQTKELREQTRLLQALVGSRRASAPRVQMQSRL